jgi:hypothetical protein
MTMTRRQTLMSAGRSIVPTLFLAIALAACSSAGSASSDAPTGQPSTGPATPPGEISPPTGESTSPGDSPPGNIGPGGSGAPIVPKPGQLDVHPIAADSFAAQVDGRHVTLTITYTSGVEPCSVLDTIIVERGDKSFAITLREGHGPGDQVCIMIARIVQTQVDLGQLDPGMYTITDTMRGADPIQVVVG